MIGCISIRQAEAIERYIDFLPKEGVDHSGWFFEWRSEDDVITAFPKDAVRARIGVLTNKQYMLNDLMRIMAKHGAFVNDRNQFKAEFSKNGHKSACILEIPLCPEQEVTDELLPNNIEQAFYEGLAIVSKYSDIKPPVDKSDIEFINSLLEKINMLLRAVSYDRRSDVWKYSEVNYVAWMDNKKVCIGIKSDYMFDPRYKPIPYLSKVSKLHEIAKAIGFDTNRCMHHAELLQNKFPVLVLENESLDDGKD